MVTSAVRPQNPIQHLAVDPSACYIDTGLTGDIIGDFWHVLSYEIYTDYRALPVLSGFEPFPWLMNDYAFIDSNVQNILVVEHLALRPEIIANLPTPDLVVDCTNSFGFNAEIWHFDQSINSYLPWEQ